MRSRTPAWAGRTQAVAACAALVLWVPPALAQEPAWPDAGFRRPRLEPVYSPVVPDFEGRSDDTRRPWELRLSLAGLAADDGRASAKLQEYRALGRADFGLEFRYRDARSFARVLARHLPLSHRDVTAEARFGDALAARVRYDQIPHNHAFGARTLHAGAGGGTLTIADGVQSTLQASASPTDATARAREALAGASSAIDLGNVRRKASVELTSRALRPVEATVEVGREARRGTRPAGSSFGLANSVELPWPVDQETWNVRGGLAYASPRLSAALSYTASSFSSGIDALRFDNPWRVEDSTARAAVSNFAAGPAAGLVDLAPANRAQALGMTASLGRLPWRGRASVTASRGWMRQDDLLLPFTVNTAVVLAGDGGATPFDASDPASLPVRRADARMDTASLHLRLQLQPLSFLRVSSHYRFYELDNGTAPVVLPGFVREDADWRTPDAPGAVFTNPPIAYRRRSAGVRGTFDVLATSRLSLGYTRERTDREFREVPQADEDRLEVAFDTRVLAWGQVRGSYQHAVRSARDYDFAQYHRGQGETVVPVLPFLRRFDQADRRQDRVQVLASVSPTETLGLSASVLHGRNQYPRSLFGLLGDRHRVYAADVAWSRGERLALHASYSHERYRYEQAGRSWAANRPGDPFLVDTTPESPGNWRADERAVGDTVGVGARLALVPGRLQLGVETSYSRSDGRILYESPLGTAAVDPNPFVPAPFLEVDDVRFRHLQSELEYRLGPRASVSVAYVWETYRLADFNRAGLVLVPATPDGAFASAIVMDTLPRPYRTHLFYVTLRTTL